MSIGLMILLVAGAAALGGLLGAVLACIPGLHVYNTMALLVIGAHALGAHGAALPVEVVAPLLLGMTVGFSLANTIPSVLLAAPDESALFTVLPGQKLLMRGRGYEAIMTTTAGGVAALLMILVVVGPLAPRVLPLVVSVLRPHTHWVIWTVIVFMLMSEWPKGGRLGAAGWSMFFDGWRTTGAGLLTFLLAGLLGFILLYRPPIAHAVSFQNLMPAFVGLFTLPWLLVNLVSRVEIPAQTREGPLLPDRTRVLLGSFAGTLGGAFAAFFPVITGGIGGLLAGHATALRDDRVFLVSQGASKTMYYVAGFLLFFVPGLNLLRGGAAGMLAGLHGPRSFYDYAMALAAIGISGAVACALIGPLTRTTMRILARTGYHTLSAATLVLTLVLVGAIAGPMGLCVLAVATGIGLLPVLLGSRRMNCLSVILLPMACNMSGFGPDVARVLGLL